MWIKDVKKYEIDVIKEDEIIYTGNVDDAPEDIKDLEAKDMKLSNNKILIYV